MTNEVVFARVDIVTVPLLGEDFTSATAPI